MSGVFGAATHRSSGAAGVDHIVIVVEILIVLLDLW
jgi:hypothetical protein